MANTWYFNKPLVHENRRRTGDKSSWVRSFACPDLRPLIICRGPIRLEAINVFEEMGIYGYGMLLSEWDSIVHPNAVSPELRKQLDPERIHRVQDYSGTTRVEREMRIRQIIDIAREHGYNAIFAGYGFMAEDVALVAAVETEGLIFIGPSSKTVSVAGPKDIAKRTALKEQLSTTPGVETATLATLLRLHRREDDLERLVDKLGIAPVGGLAAYETLESKGEALLNAATHAKVDLFSIDDLAETLVAEIRVLFLQHPGTRIRLKAVGGGGGKGQRILEAPAAFEGSDMEKVEKALAQITPRVREVLSEVKAIGEGENKNVLAELNVENVRHIEIQLIGNGDWCISLGGRECSVQMNQQKLLEVSMTVEELEQAIIEARTCGDDDAERHLSMDLRLLKKMETQAVQFGVAVNLDSVSAYECIVEGDQHYFMEVNTRIQVEHRVTDLCYQLRFTNPDDHTDSFVVTSTVELMVLLALHGKRLPCPTRERREGSSLEVRVNATDAALKPHAGGTITYWSDPVPGEIRDDQGIGLRNPDTDSFMRYHLTGAYDSNIALLLTAGDDRTSAFARMSDIVRRMKVSGENLNTNLDFHYGLINWFIGHDPRARPSTDFIASYIAAVGQLKRFADSIDPEAVYREIQSFYLSRSSDPRYLSAVSEILMRKMSLLTRPVAVILSRPHSLAGWLALNRHCFEVGRDSVHWLTNPLEVLSELYKYLNMEQRDGVPALHAIWDHDAALLRTGLEFYATLKTVLKGCDWCSIVARLDEECGADDEMRRIINAHNGFQMGMEVLSVLPYIACRSCFLDLRVSSDLSIETPPMFTDSMVRRDSVHRLSPPPASTANEITAPSGGMYYARESPGAEPFVVSGQHFEVGQPLFMIEVMKMFNKVHAPFSGTIDEVLIASEATIVRKGQAIFKVTPDEPFNDIATEDPHIGDISDILRFVGMSGPGAG